MVQKWESKSKHKQSQGSDGGSSWSRSSSEARSSGSSGSLGDGLWAAFVGWLKRIFGA